MKLGLSLRVIHGDRRRRVLRALIKDTKEEENLADERAKDAESPTTVANLRTLAIGAEIRARY